ncbi:hypothetical protein J1N35_008641 [Gossypium stocksii]|uniref:Secreted protein n=1 Tax=Gossypium stocksii TaxID=47602 RepID=A0A9D3WAP2_9ROSI|nr:hypothetical protein J1N35_008641 [Gossypium stocksii]
MQRELWLHAVGGLILPLPKAALPFGCSCILELGRLQSENLPALVSTSWFLAGENLLTAPVQLAYRSLFWSSNDYRNLLEVQ